ncbi:hypothetical protein GCM10007108_17110 [Thermogymnomonas acidicola]|uniref:Uncharacterized protein n=1 Tax=Thermogymnomonas acidicola TaxID=399579 RepID=A0AA37BSN4_9ARCH|nr:hypothetical protein GCM10007108_17110 [Thermogymnomonas acidicola]
MEGLGIVIAAMTMEAIGHPNLSFLLNLAMALGVALIGYTSWLTYRLFRKRESGIRAL